MIYLMGVFYFFEISEENLIDCFKSKKNAVFGVFLQ